MNGDFLEALRAIEKEKDIPFDVLVKTVEQALASAYKKNFATAGDVNVRVEITKSGFRVYCEKLVVERVINEHTEISLTEAQQYAADIAIGDIIEIEVTPEDFGRIAAQTAKQVVMQRIREAERKQVFQEYSEKIGEVVTGTVQRHDQRQVYVNLGKIEALLPLSEQVPSEPYRFNDRIKVYILQVTETSKGAQGAQVIVSRSHPNLIRRLFELEVPEIHEGIVTIKSVAREPGVRSKIAVASKDERVDPVGACVGHRGSRVQAIVNELYDEKIDIIRWHEAPEKFVAEALSPARVVSVTVDEDMNTALVIVPDNQLSLAIGKAGQNVRLAARLTGWRIDIRSESQATPQTEGEISEQPPEGESTTDSYFEISPMEDETAQSIEEQTPTDKSSLLDTEEYNIEAEESNTPQQEQPE